MNKLLALALSMYIALPSWAQGIEHDNRLYFTMSDTDEKRQVTLTLHLENPSVVLTAVEVYVSLPERTVMSEGKLAARATQHELKEGCVEDMHFVSIASPSLTTFTGVDGGTGMSVPSEHCGRLIMYDLRGQRIVRPQQGKVHIINGEKRLTHD